MEKATLTPFSYRGSGSALRSQKTSWFPSGSRFELLDVAAGAAVVLEGGLDLDSVADLGFALLFAGGRLI